MTVFCKTSQLDLTLTALSFSYQMRTRAEVKASLNTWFTISRQDDEKLRLVEDHLRREFPSFADKASLCSSIIVSLSLRCCHVHCIS